MREAGRARGQARRGRRRSGAAVCASPSSSGGRARASRSFRWGRRARPGRVLVGALRRGARLRSGRARDRGGADCDRRPPRRLRGRPSAADRGALRRRRGQHGEVALAAAAQHALPRAGPAVSLPAAPGRRLRARAAAGARVRSALPRLLGHAALEARGGAGRPAVRGRAARPARRTRSCASRAGAGAPRTRTSTAIFDPLADHDTGEGRSAVVLGAGGAARAASSRRAGSATRSS